MDQAWQESMAHQYVDGEIFTGNSKAAELMRSHPWSESTLGEPQTWPPSLKTTLGILLNSGCPMFCVWGRDRTLFYNDAAAALLGQGQQFPAMGQSLSQGFVSGRDGIALGVERVFATGQPLHQPSHDLATGNGQAPAQGYPWSYSPIWNDAGQVEGVFGSSSQAPQTGGFVGQEPAGHPVAIDWVGGTADLQRVTDAVPVLIAFVDKQQRYRFVNQTYEAWFGLSPTQVHHQPVRQVLGEAAYDAVLPYIEQALAGHTVTFEQEISFRLGGTRHIEATYVPQLNAQGAVEGFVALITDISQRKQADARRQQAETALQESEARFRRIADSSPMMIWMSSPDGAGTWFNEQWYEFTGQTPAEALGEGWLTALHPDDAQMIEQTCAQAHQNQESVWLEYRLRRQDGTYRWVLDSAIPRFNDQGDCLGYIGSIIDIHDRKQTEMALRQQRVILEAVLRQAGDAIVVCNGKGQLTFVNREARRLAQLDPEDTTLDIGLQAWGTAYDSEGNLIALENYSISKALRGEATSAYEARMVRQDGSYYDILISAAPLWNDHQRIVGAVATFMDISDRKRSEEALRESEERFRNLADTISQFAWMADPNGWIFWYNQRWFDYTGTTLEQMQGWGWTQVHHPDHVDRVVSHFRRSIETGEPWEDTFPIRGKDGQYHWFLSRAMPIRDGMGDILRWFGTNTDITERKRAEEALAQRQAELSLVTNAAPALIAFVDADQRYRFNNNRYETWLGHPAADLHGKHLREVFDEAAYAEIQPHVERVLLGQEVTYERKLTHIDGTVRDVSVTYVPRFSDTGQVEGFVALISDISDRKRAEAALRQSEDRLRMAVESAQMGIWDWNLATNDLTWDTACKRIFGLPDDSEVTIETFFAGVHPDDHNRIVQVVEESLQAGSGGLYDAEFRVVGLQDGVERWVLTKGKVYFSSKGTPQRFTGTILDISGQKRFEQALMASEALARARAEELTAIMETTPAGIWIAHDPDCHHITGNQTACDLMRMPPGSITTATPAPGEPSLPFLVRSNGQPIAPEDLPMQKAARTGREVTGELDFNFDDGTVSYIYGKAVPLFAANGRVRGAIGGFVDITALKHSEQERERLLQRERQARAEAENASRIKDEFLAILSHELRSPLNPILGWISLLRQGQLDAAKTAIALETIERNAKLQIQLIDDLLDVSRIIRGKLSLTMVPIDLTTTIKAAIETVRLAAEAKAIPIYTHFDPAVGRVLGDSARLQQVIWNLLSNAVKFTPAGGRVEVRLEQVWGEGSQGARERESQGARELGRGEGYQVSGPRSQGEGFQVPGPRSQGEGYQVSGPRSQEEDSIGHPEPDTQNPELDTRYLTPDTRYPTYAQITVTDTGKGISTSFLPHVFEYFRQADSTTTRTFGGLGLGLAIVHYLVELHGGTVWADSPGEGQGATFTVHLPIIKDKKPEMTTAAHAIPLLAQTSALQGLQLLLVDDDADTRDFLSVILEYQGAEITTAASAQEALQALERSSFDLIISDIGMPNMDGYTLMQQIRGGITHQSRRVPAIALTAYAAESDRERALAAGFQQHLPKPVEVDQLIDIILKLTR